MANRSWLRSLCRSGYASTYAPLPVTWDGTSWDCATDGHAFVLLRGATVPERADAPDIARVLDEFKQCGHADISLAALRAWAECPLLRELCSVCKGRGTLFNWGPHGCGYCEGAGTNPPRALEVKFFGRHVDRRLVWKFVRNLPAEPDGVHVRFGRDGDYAPDPIWLTGEGWHVVLMPMRSREDDQYGEPFPKETR